MCRKVENIFCEPRENLKALSEMKPNCHIFCVYGLGFDKCSRAVRLLVSKKSIDRCHWLNLHQIVFDHIMA